MEQQKTKLEIFSFISFGLAIIFVGGLIYIYFQRYEVVSIINQAMLTSENSTPQILKIINILIKLFILTMISGIIGIKTYYKKFAISGIIISVVSLLVTVLYILMFFAEAFNSVLNIG